ncbi:unnamed protein product, partial [Prunus brigantina]
SKVKCFKCQKFGHYANKCKVKDAIRQLQITDEERAKLIKVLELRNSESENELTMLSHPESSSPESKSSDSPLSSPNIQLGCKDKCCNILKSISVLTKQEEQEELLIDLISKIENPELKSEYLKKLRKIITQEASTSQPSPSTISLNTTLERFHKKKDIALHDLHTEVKIVKKEILELKQMSYKLQTENYDIRQNLNALLEKESPKNSPPHSPAHSEKSEMHEQAINLINHVPFRKWYSKITIIVENFEFNTIALFDSGADLNCIREGLIPTKYYKKSKESLSTASGKLLKLNYEIPKAHVCQNRVCFKTSFVLIKNITDRVILGLPFISLLYPLQVEFDGVVSSYLGEKVKFEFLTRSELHDLKILHRNVTTTLIHDKTNQIRYLQDEVKNKRIESQLINPSLQQQILEFEKKLIHPIDRAIQFADKFPDQITDKTQLQRFLGSLNYVSDFYQNLRKQCKPLFDRLQDNPPPWSSTHTEIVKQIKHHVKSLPCLGIPDIHSFKIVETDASEIGYGGIIKQKTNSTPPEQIVRFHSGIWTKSQSNYSTIKKEILAIVLCITKFQDDLLNQKILVRVDCKSAKHVLEKDVQNIASKQIFARWQALLSIFDFDIEFLKGSENSIPDFLTREFLQD